jgi:hypothetical protein
MAASMPPALQRMCFNRKGQPKNSTTRRAAVSATPTSQAAALRLYSSPGPPSHQMPPDLSDEIPTVNLLLNQVRRFRTPEVRQLVSEVLGDFAAASVRAVGENPGMEYIDWRDGEATYHLGTSSEPYINTLGTGKVGPDGRVSEMKWTMREEVPPPVEAHAEAWMSHTAWLYIDALLHNVARADRPRHQQNVLKLAGRLVDARCVLVWLHGRDPKRTALPSHNFTQSLRSGIWPD